MKDAMEDYCDCCGVEEEKVPLHHAIAQSDYQEALVLICDDCMSHRLYRKVNIGVDGTHKEVH